MLRVLIVIVVAACVTAEENRWVWGKNHRNQRAFSNDEGDKYGNSYYGREKDREPTTRRPSTGQANDEDFLNPDELRNYNGQSNFGYPPLGSEPGLGNNFPSGYGSAPGAISPQSYPSNGYPGPSAQGQGNYPSGPSGFGGGYPTAGAGGYPSAPGNGYPTQGGYPNQGGPQGYPPSGPFPSGPSAGGYQGFPGYPGLGNIFAPSGGYPGQGGYPLPGQGVAPNIANQGGYPGFGVGPYPTQGGGYPYQPGYPTQPGYSGQYPGGNNYPQQGGQYPTGQYIGCSQYGGPQCAGGQLGQYPVQYPGQYPSPYPGQYPSGQYPFPDPYGSYNPNNPYGITPYNKAGGYASSFDDYDEISKNATSGSTRALKPEGKSLNINTFAPSSLDDKLRKIKKS